MGWSYTLIGCLCQYFLHFEIDIYWHDRPMIGSPNLKIRLQFWHLGKKKHILWLRPKIWPLGKKINTFWHWRVVSKEGLSLALKSIINFCSNHVVCLSPPGFNLCSVMSKMTIYGFSFPHWAIGEHWTLTLIKKKKGKALIISMGNTPAAACASMGIKLFLPCKCQFKKINN